MPSLRIEGVKGRELGKQALKLPAAELSAALQVVVDRVKAVRGQAPTDEFDSNTYIRLAVGVLAEAGTDEQILEAFGNPTEFGSLAMYVGSALAACKGPQGAEIVERFVRGNLSEIEEVLKQVPPGQEPPPQVEELVTSAIWMMCDLATSANPIAQQSAARLRPEYYRLFGDGRWRDAIRAFDAEIAKRQRTKGFAPTFATPLPGYPVPKDNPAKTTEENSRPEHGWFTGDQLAQWFFWASVGLALFVAVKVGWRITHKKLP